MEAAMVNSPVMQYAITIVSIVPTIRQLIVLKIVLVVESPRLPARLRTKKSNIIHILCSKYT